MNAPETTPRLGRGPRTGGVLALGVLVTVLNALKPLHMDDAAYHAFAAHIAHAPLDPYGFTLFWYQRPQPAFEVLAPPVLPYWWALAIRLFGERPFGWKLWLLPFSLLLVVGLRQILRRFGRGLETPLVWLTVVSPAVLPGLNLMLDVPALALSLLALARFLDACDRQSKARAVLSGLLAGLAMQTKYTALVCPAVCLLYAMLFRRPRLAAIAGTSALLVFVGWEAVMAGLYGESHFLHHCRGHGDALRASGSPLPALVTLLGGLAPATALLGLVALGVRGRTVAATLGLVGFGFVLVGVGGEAGPGPLARIPVPSASCALVTLRGSREGLLFGALGWLVCGTLGGIAGRFAVGGGRDRPARRADWFLVLWLLLEVAGYAALSPFPAARRALGVFVAGTVLAGRLASRTCRSRRRRFWVGAVTAFGAFLGLGYYLVDLRDASAQKEAAERAAGLVRPGDGAVWYVGHWGFQYYAERAGMRPVVPGVSRLRKGDWLVVPDGRVHGQAIALSGRHAEPVAHFGVEDCLPVRTVAGYYGSRFPLEPHHGPRLSVTVYRVTADSLPPRRE